MAIYHLSVKPVQRSKGRSSTAAAAYRAGCIIEDKRTGLKHDYTKKAGVEYTEIITPNGIEIPNRSDLWNMAEAAEKRKDGCTAREYEVNLPHELTAQQRIELAQDFSRQLAKTHGIAVDLCIHKPTDKEIAAGTDPRNHHAHILTTTRKITNEGLTDKADIEKAGRRRKDDLAATRELWADTANKHFEMAGLEQRIDSRSLKDQGSALKPTIKLGKTASEMERQGIKTIKGGINRTIKSDNEQIVALENSLYLDRGRLAAQQKIEAVKSRAEQEPYENNSHQQDETETAKVEPRLTIAERRELWKAQQEQKNQPEPSKPNSVSKPKTVPEPVKEPQTHAPRRGLRR